MRFAIAGSVAFIGVLGLAACSNNADAPAGKTEAAKGGDAAPAMLEGPKPGKWRITTAMEGMPGGAAIAPTEICVTQAVLEAPGGANAQAQGADCTVTPYKREGDATVATSTCKLPGNMTTTSAVRITGDFNSRYVTEVTTKMDPAPAPNLAETKMTITSERIGDC